MVESISKFEILQGWREVVYRVVEGVPKSESCEKVREVVNRVVEAVEGMDL